MKQIILIICVGLGLSTYAQNSTVSFTNRGVEIELLYRYGNQVMVFDIQDSVNTCTIKDLNKKGESVCYNEYDDTTFRVEFLHIYSSQWVILCTDEKNIINKYFVTLN